jgi:hypothetical protein
LNVTFVAAHDEGREPVSEGGVHESDESVRCGGLAKEAIEFGDRAGGAVYRRKRGEGGSAWEVGGRGKREV